MNDFKELYKYIKTADLPKTPPGVRPCTVTKPVPGYGEVTITYDKYGFPKFESFSPKVDG